MRLTHAAAVIVAGAVLVPTGSAQASGQRSAESTNPVMRYAKTSVIACRGRSGGFSTATFTAVNRGDAQAFANAWADRGHRMEIGSQGLTSGERGELGEYGTTGSMRDVEFHLVIRVDGVTRTKVIMGHDLPRC